MGRIGFVIVFSILLSGCSIFRSKTTDRTTQSTLINPSVTLEGNRLYTKDAIDFDKSTHNLTYVSKAALRDIASFLKNNTDSYSHLLIEAHTDKMNTQTESMALSHQYALAVKTELINAGVPAEKIETKGYGFSRPKSSVGLLGRDRLPSQIADGVDRRIEFVVVK